MQARLRGALHEREAIEESYVQCFVYPEAKDGGEVARTLIGATLGKVIPAKDQQWVDVHGDHTCVKRDSGMDMTIGPDGSLKT